jgi:hypothetical protein
LELANKSFNQYEAETSSKINELKTKKSISKDSLNELYSTLNALKSSKDTKVKEINNQIIEAE